MENNQNIRSWSTPDRHNFQNLIIWKTMYMEDHTNGKMEDDLKFLENGRRPQLENGRRPELF